MTYKKQALTTTIYDDVNKHTCFFASIGYIVSM